jgi:hypothetical protein
MGVFIKKPVLVQIKGRYRPLFRIILTVGRGSALSAERKSSDEIFRVSPGPYQLSNY